MVKIASQSLPTTGQSHWSRLSDEELVAYEFLHSDPAKLEGLHNSVPESDEVPEVEFTYDTRNTSVGQVRCIHCRKNAPNHNRGFVLRFSDGTRMLFGKDCGQKIYGSQFEHNQREFSSAQHRSDLLKRRKSLFERKSELIELFQWIAANNSWAAYADTRVAFNNAFPELARELRTAGAGDGFLSAPIQVPDAEKEAEYEKRTGRPAVFYKIVTNPIHRLEGASFFLGVPGLTKEVADLCGRATTTLYNLDGAAAQTNQDIKLLLAGLSNIAKALSDRAEHIAELPVALSQRNIDGIAKWVEAFDPGLGRLQLSGNKLHLLKRNGEVRLFSTQLGGPRRAEIDLPTKFAPPLELVARAESLIP